MNDLSNFNATSLNIQPAGSMLTLSPPYINSEIYSDIEQLPNNQLSNLAKEIFLALSQGNKSDKAPLNTAYINQIGFIIAASKWADQPD